MSELKRLDNARQFGMPCLSEYPNGRYVKYEDHEQLQKELDELAIAAIELCNAVENEEGLYPTTYAIRCLKVAGRIKTLIAHRGKV